MNKTNAMTIASLYGNEITAWMGKRITLYSARVTAFGRTTDAVRVRPHAPQQQRKAPPPEPQQREDTPPPYDPETGEVYADEYEHAGPPPMSEDELAAMEGR